MLASARLAHVADPCAIWYQFNQDTPLLGPRRLEGRRPNMGYLLSDLSISYLQLLVRVGDVVTLNQVDAQVTAGLVLLHRFDALGDRLRVDPPGEIDEHAHEVLLDRLRGERRDQALRHLEVIG